MTEISVTYTSIDRVRMTRKYKGLKAAQRFAHKYVGRHPEVGSFYAVSSDGVGKVMCSGVTLDELFPEPQSTYRCSFCGGEQLGPDPAFCHRDGCYQEHRPSGVMGLVTNPSE